MRRLADIEAKAVAMWLSSGGDLKPWHVDELKDDAAEADKTARNQNGAAGGVGAGGAATAGSNLSWFGDPNWLLTICAVATIAAVIVVVVKARLNRERAAAYRAIAATAEG